jgi:hypothetical protein
VTKLTGVHCWNWSGFGHFEGGESIFHHFAPL